MRAVRVPIEMVRELPIAYRVGSILVCATCCV
jgi:hypothetical protein